jgi:hypothetical protein
MEIVGQMNDISFEHKKLTFEQAAKKYKLKFKGSNGRLFKRECREIFDREREKAP